MASNFHYTVILRISPLIKILNVLSLSEMSVTGKPLLLANWQNSIKKELTGKSGPRG